MESRYKLLGHPIHPMLIPYPLALLSTAAVFDVIGLLTRDGMWHTVAFWMIAAGLIVGLVAALFGLLDFLNIPGQTRAKSVALTHGIGNVVVVVLFAASWWLRTGNVPDPGLLPIVLGLLGAGLVGVTAWLGGELPYRLGIGIDEGANPDASNSLSHEPIRIGDRAARP
ncbi:MAG: DUF2231 domain-containing protein [Chloroflexota bacterium]|nr:DUF2231 domain-containing protein [Chloroflexota bacterium]